MRIGPIRQVSMILAGMIAGFLLAIVFFAAEGRKLDAEINRTRDEVRTWMDLAKLRQEENEHLAREIEASTCDGRSH